MTCLRYVRSSRLLTVLFVTIGTLSAAGFLSPVQADEPTSQPVGHSATGYFRFDENIKPPGTLSPSFIDLEMASEAFFIQSNNVLGEVVIDPDVIQTKWYRSVKAQSNSKLLDNLRKILTVQRVPNTTFLEVTVTLPNRDEARILANKVMEKYFLKSTQFSSKEYLEKVEALSAEFVRLDRQAKEKRGHMEKAFKELINFDGSSADQALRFWQEEYLKQQRLVIELEAGATSQPSPQPGGNTLSHPDRLVVAQKLLLQLKDKYEKALVFKWECYIKKNELDTLNDEYRRVWELSLETLKPLSKLQIDGRDTTILRWDIIQAE